MAKCGCDVKCHCTVTAGSCVTVTGTGNGAADPYIVNAVVDGQTIFCTANGLEARLNTLDTNTVDLTGDGTAANPLKADVILTPDGQVPDPNALGTGNLIKLGPTGIYVSCEDVQDCVGAAVSMVNPVDCLVYNDVTNKIDVLLCAEPNGVECAQPGDVPGCTSGLSVIPSSDANNGLMFGTDLRLFYDAPAIQAGDCITITGTGTTADPFVITPQVAPELNGLECIPGQGLLVTPSSDANNGLVFGTDQRLYVNSCPYQIGAAQILFGNNGPCFEFQGDGCNTPLVATLRVSTFLCNGVECRADGLYVQADNSPIPAPVRETRDTPPFPGLGPFNGTNGLLVVDGPTCITINNPSPCRSLVTTVTVNGFTDVGRQSGSMSAQFEIADNPGGPWQTIHRNGMANPQPPSRQTQNASFQGRDVTIPPGGSRQICSRVTVSFAGANTGRLFFSEKTISLVGRWAS